MFNHQDIDRPDEWRNNRWRLAMKMRKYYGIRFLGGNRTCTTGSPNEITGRMSIACNLEVFRSRADRDAWIEKEKLSAPCGCDGGERIASTKRECRSYRLGDTVEQFNETLEFNELYRYAGE